MRCVTIWGVSTKRQAIVALGVAVDDYLRSQGISQSALAKSLSVQRSQITRLVQAAANEGADAQVGVKALRALAKLFPEEVGDVVGLATVAGRRPMWPKPERPMGRGATNR